MQTLWIVCPVYHDVPAFAILKRRIEEVVGGMAGTGPASLRFVVVDDSAGQDVDILTLRAMTGVTVVDVPFNLGHQRAIVRALRSLGSVVRPTDVVVTMDADGQDQPTDLPRLLAALSAPIDTPQVVLALRTRRRESLSFAVMYRLFVILFRVLTGTVIRTGNFAAFWGSLTRQVIWHPHFDLSYSSALLSLRLRTALVPCERAERYAGASKMNFERLIMHGLGMLMPYVDRIATRALMAFGATFAGGVIVGAGVLALRVFTTWHVPAWALTAVSALLIVSFVALGHFIVLFVVFAGAAGSALRTVRDTSPADADRAFARVD